MPFCPKCQAEYREGFTVCKDCEVNLVDELTPENIIYDLSEAEMVPLAYFKTPAEAQMVHELLEKRGVRSMVQGASDTIAAVSGFTEVSVLVDERDVPRAKEIFDAYFSGEVELPEGAEIPEGITEETDTLEDAEEEQK